MNMMNAPAFSGANDGVRLDTIRAAFKEVEEAYRALYPLLPRNSFRGSLNRAMRSVDWAVRTGRIIEDADRKDVMKMLGESLADDRHSRA